MCGIVALISLKKERVDIERMKKFISHIEHRGNDDFGIENPSESVCLGCHRLAITGTENSKQPFSNETKDLTVVFNGEIYNYQSLRKKLIKLGYKFKSDSDTEILVHGYRQWGEKIGQKLRGMYAFVIYDNQRKEVFAMRDPLGIKPLYYAKNVDMEAFSSEIYPLVEAGFENIRFLRPGEYLKNGKSTLLAFNFQPAKLNISFEEAKTKLRQLIRQSVERMVNTDLEIGVLCSGGIDSSIILWEAAQIRPVTVYCVGTQNSEDPKFAGKFVKWLKEKFEVSFKHTPINKDAMLRRIPQTIQVIESFEPNHIRAGTANLALAEQISKDKIKIVVVGEGADELFGGYEEFSHMIAKETTDKNIAGLFERFLSELHKTQLQRVDRVTMAYGIEARVPYLESELIKFVTALPTEMKLHIGENGAVSSKFILREAYRDILPEYIVNRRKVPMGEGAGLGDNGPEGPFYDHTNAQIPKSELENYQQEYPMFKISNKEEAYYFSIFLKRFGNLKMASDRPLTNIMSTKPLAVRKGLI